VSTWRMKSSYWERVGREGMGQSLSVRAEQGIQRFLDLMLFAAQAGDG
jgi:hypothetical protein